MSSSEFPRDKERGAQPPAPQPSLDEQHAAATTERQQFNRRVAFLLVLLWIFWMLGSFADTILAVDWAWRKSFYMNPLTPLQTVVYQNKWFLWLFLHYPLSLEPAGVFDKICLVSLTMCLVLMVAYGNTMKDAKDDVASAISYLVMGATLVGPKMMGSNQREIFVVFMPLGWLIFETALVLLQRAGVGDLGKALGFSEKVGHWIWNSSRLLFFGANVWIFGARHELVMLMVLVEIVNRVYKMLG